MLKTIKNNSVILVDPNQEDKVIAHLLLEMNAVLSPQTVKLITTLDESEQMQLAAVGEFPFPYRLLEGCDYAVYRTQDIMDWLKQID